MPQGKPTNPENFEFSKDMKKSRQDASLAAPQLLMQVLARALVKV
jgi:hypothetical protein